MKEAPPRGELVGVLRSGEGRQNSPDSPGVGGGGEVGAGMREDKRRSRDGRKRLGLHRGGNCLLYPSAWNDENAPGGAR